MGSVSFSRLAQTPSASGRPHQRLSPHRSQGCSPRQEQPRLRRAHHKTPPTRGGASLPRSPFPQSEAGGSHPGKGGRLPSSENGPQLLPTFSTAQRGAKTPGTEPALV